MENSDGAKIKAPRDTDDPDIPYKSLRMPNSTNPLLQNIYPESNNKSKPSNLRAEAAEWYPPTHSRNISVPSTRGNRACGGFAQQRLNKYKLHQEQSDSSDMSSSGVVDMDYDFENVCIILTELVAYPGKYDDSLDTFNDILHNSSERDVLVPKITDFIFKLAIFNHNFRYNGARLCLNIMKQFPSLEKYLLKMIDETINTCLEPGVVSFLGELLLQFDYNIDFANYLLTALNKMIDNDNAENIKAVCQTLKLTGWCLESLDPISTTFILSRLKELKNQAPNNTQNLITMVLSLKDLNWGKTASEASQSEKKIEWSDNSGTENPTLYGPDGMELSLEEQEFLAKNCTTDFDEYDSDPDLYYDADPDINKEMEAAFEEFVKLNN